MIVKYINLSANIEFYRPFATSSEIKVKFSGNYFNGNFGNANNELNISWAYKEKETDNYGTSKTLTPTISNNKYSGDFSLGEDFDYKKKYYFILYVSDKLSSVNVPYPLKAGEPFYDYGVDDEGNNYFNVNGDFYCKNKKVISADDKWVTATLTSDFTAYDGTSSNTPEYKKMGKLIEIRGKVSPTSAIAGSATSCTIFTLPEGYRPSKEVYSVCQGSGKNTWLLGVYPSGNVTFSRYGTTEYIDTPINAWLLLNVIFSID